MPDRACGRRHSGPGRRCSRGGGSRRPGRRRCSRPPGRSRAGSAGPLWVTLRLHDGVMCTLPGYFRAPLAPVRAKYLSGMFPRRIGQPGCSRRDPDGVLPAVIIHPQVNSTLRAVDRDSGGRGRLGRGLDPDELRPEPGGDRQARRCRRLGRAGYCASHSRFSRGLRLHRRAPWPGCRSVAIAGARADERQSLLGMLVARARRHGRARGARSETRTTSAGPRRRAHRTSPGRRPVRKARPRAPARPCSTPLRQVIESVNQTLKGQLDLERHGGRPDQGILARIQARILALTP